MSRTLRLLPFAVADGPTHMAADEVLLETAAAHGPASLRFYVWSEPTLSLGYFQPVAARDAPPLDRLPYVRRSTGGAGIVHHHELTYALALPPGPLWHSTEPWLCRMHRVLAEVLDEHGVAARVVACGEEQKRGDVLCFLHHAPGDLIVGGSKVAGSAQRKLRGALLQHGSLLLRQSPFAPQLPGIHDRAGRDLFSPRELAGLLAERFARAVGAELEPTDWTPQEQDRVAVVRADRYANPQWTHRR